MKFPDAVEETLEGDILKTSSGTGAERSACAGGG